MTELKQVQQQKSQESLRASIMIAEMAKQYDLPVDGDDKEFQMVCFDITWFPLQSCVKKANHEKMKNKLIAECKKVRTE